MLIINFFIVIFFVSELCYGLEASRHYVYKYSGSFKSGIPDDGPQVSGFAMKALIDVYVENNDGIAIFKLSDVSILTFNEELQVDLGSENFDFRDERFHPFEDKNLATTIEQPFRVNLRGSEPFAIEYEETEHRWLANVRKGIASMFKNEILKGNYETQVQDSISSSFNQGHLVNNFIVEEETLFGICKAKYKIYQLPDTMFTSSSDFAPTSEEGTIENLWYVSRTMDFDKCTEIVAIHIHTTNSRNKAIKDKNLRFSRSSISSYVLRGSPGHFDLYSVVTDGETTFPLSSFNEQEEAQTTVKQKLILVKNETTEAVPELGSSLKRSGTWMHEVWSQFHTPKEGKPHPWIVYSDENKSEFVYEMFGSRNYDDDQIAAIKVNIFEIIRNASKRLIDLRQEEEDPPSYTISGSLEVANIYFKFLKKENILQIFDDIFEGKIGLERNLVINSAVASGSSEAMEAIMDYMEKDKLEPIQIFTTFLTLNRNSYGSLNISRMMDFLLREEKPSPYLINFAHYLSEYCIHKVHSYTPTLGDSACDSSIITKRFIPYLKETIYNENLTWERAYAVKVLNVLRTCFTFEIVSPLLDGSVKSSVPLKVMAVRALENWNIYPEATRKKLIIDLLRDVYSDISQDLHVRSAALLTILTWQPSTKSWYSLALSTWKEPSKGLASFTTSLIKAYAELDVPTLKEQSKGASYALKFSKPPINYLSYNLAGSNKLFSYLIHEVKKGDRHYMSNFIVNILSNIKGLSLIKMEEIALNFERVTLFNETMKNKYSRIPYAKEFLDKLLKEIGLAQHPSNDKTYSDSFIEILDDIYFTRNLLKNTPFLHTDDTDASLLYGGGYFYLMDKSDFHPNELGLPIFTHSSMPTALSYTTKFLPPKSGLLPGVQSMLKISSVYYIGISVYLPWKYQFSSTMIASSIEITLPIGKVPKRNILTEGHLKSTKTLWDIVYKKKFPLIRVSRIPMTATYIMDPKRKEDLGNFEVIKKQNINTKRINQLDQFTGIKYDLVLAADIKTSFGFGTFLQFPNIESRFWSFDLFIEPEESETNEMLVTKSTGYLLDAKDIKNEGSDFDSNNEETNESKDEITIWDSFIERSRKIRNFVIYDILKFSFLRYNELKFDFIGKVNRKFEVFSAAGLSEGPFQHNFWSLGLTGLEQQFTPKSMCLNLHSTYSMDDAGNIVEKDTRLDALYRCTQNIFRTFVNVNINEDRLTKVTKYCKENYGEENCFVDYGNLLTHGDIRITFKDNDNETLKNVIYSMKSFFEIPSVKSLTYQIPKYNPEFNIRRNPYNGNWDLSQKFESEDVFLATFSDNLLLRDIRDYPMYNTPEYIFKHSEIPSKCTLTNNSVETFDGVKYNYELSNCWTLVSQIPSTSEYFVNNVFLIRKAEGRGSVIPDFKYILFEKETVIELSNSELKINGSIVHRIKEDETNYSGEIENGLLYKRGNIYLIYPTLTFNRPVVIINIDRIELYKEVKDEISNGICGNGDGESITELIGPKQCVYDDAQLFTASWTGQSENCDSDTLKNYRKGVEDYQANCKTYDGQPNDIKINERCLFYGWNALIINENYCIATLPLPFCSSTCDIKEVKTAKITYKCWPKEKAPEILKTSIENQVNIITEAISADPYLYEYSSTEYATLCKKF